MAHEVTDRTDKAAQRGWFDAVDGISPDAAPGYIRRDPVLWALYLYGYSSVKEAHL